MVFDELQRDSLEETESKYTEKAFLFNVEKRRIESATVLKEKLENMGIKSDEKELEKFHPSFSKILPSHLEGFFESYPESRGFLTSIRAVKLPEGVLAQSGPYLNEKGEFAGGEVQFNKDFFGKGNYEYKIVDLESDLNWRGERWIAGQGSKGIVSHEMAHLLALRINAEDAGLSIGEDDHWKFDALQKRYAHNSKIITLCNNALKELEISPRNIGRELSTYASGDFGELFSEAISQYETCKKPGRLSTEIHKRYMELVEERIKDSDLKEVI